MTVNKVKVLAANIAAQRTKKGWTQKELADLLHVSKQTISNWETGTKSPRMGKLQQLADIFQLSLSELLSANPVSFSQEVLYLPFIHPQQNLETLADQDTFTLPFPSFLLPLHSTHGLFFSYVHEISLNQVIAKQDYVLLQKESSPNKFKNGEYVLFAIRGKLHYRQFFFDRSNHQYLLKSCSHEPLLSDWILKEIQAHTEVTWLGKIIFHFTKPLYPEPPFRRRTK